MDDDLDAAAGLASLASSGTTTAPSGKGKPRAPRKTATAPKPKKKMMHEERARESAKRKGRSKARVGRKERSNDRGRHRHTNTRVAAAKREAMLYLGLNPGQHGLVNAAVAAASTDSSAFPRMVLPESPRASATRPISGFDVYPQASRLFEECSSEVSVVAPSTPPPAPAPIDLNATPVAGGSSSGGPSKRAREMPADMFPGARNLFDTMPAADNDIFMQNIIFEGGTAAARGAAAAGYDPDETQSQDGQGAFMLSTFGQAGMQATFMQDQAGMQATFMQDQVGLDLDEFPLNHEFPEDYGLEEEDKLDIDDEPLFEHEVTNQAAGAKPKRKSRRTNAYTAAEDKLLCECWRGIGQDPKTDAEQKASTFWTRVHREFCERKKFFPYQIQSTRGWVSISKRWKVIQQECNKFCATLESIKACPVSGIDMQDMAFQALEAFKVQHDGRSFGLSHCWRVIKDEEKFKAQYAALMARGGKKVVEEVGEGEKARPRGKTNSKKEDKRDVASIGLIASVEAMMTKKNSREEKCRRDKEEEMNTFMESRLEMEAEKQARCLRWRQRSKPIC